MEIGIGLPTTIPGATGREVTEWARRADAAGFSTLGTLDRVVYPNHEPLIAYGAAAAVTERIRLTTAIAILPYRANAVLVAKQAATLQVLSEGRFVFGVAVGGRADDYEASGVPMQGRGKRFEEMLATLRRVWAGETFGWTGAVGPDVSDDPPQLIVGGQVDATFRRAAEYGDGWIMGGGPADAFAPAVERLEAAWGQAGRHDRPRRMALTYFSLDDDPEQQARRTIGHYYSFLGEYAEQVVASVAKGDDEVRERVRGFEAAGCDELILFPASSNPDEVDRLAAVTNVM